MPPKARKPRKTTASKSVKKVKPEKLQTPETPKMKVNLQVLKPVVGKLDSSLKTINGLFGEALEHGKKIKKIKLSIKNDKIVETSKTCLAYMKTMAASLVKSTAHGSKYLVKGSKQLLNKGEVSSGWLAAQVQYLRNIGEIAIDGIMRKNSVLIKVPLPPKEKGDNSTPLERISEEIVKVLPEDEEDNLVVLNLDEYFSQVDKVV